MQEFQHQENQDFDDQSKFSNVHFFTDFMKYFDIVKHQTDIPGETTNVTLRCSALLKLLPYEGFYPANRTLQLVNIYAEDYISGSLNTDNSVTNAQLSFLSKQFFAPGILFNSIKSGIAVDYPIFENNTEYSNSSRLFDGAITNDLLKQNAYGSAIKGSFINSTEDIRSHALGTFNNYLSNQKGDNPRIRTDVANRDSFRSNY